MSSPRLSARHRHGRLPTACIVMAGMIAACAVATLSAEPVRRTSRKSQPATTARAAPDVTGTITNDQGEKPKGTPPAAAQDDETVPPPFNLPTAPRARMRACGEQWQEIKMAGTAADQTWREFATKCLSQPAPAGPAAR